MSSEKTTEELVKEYLAANDLGFEDKPTEKLEFRIVITKGLDIPTSIFKRIGKNFITVSCGFIFKDEHEQNVVSNNQVLDNIRMPLFTRGIDFGITTNEKKLITNLTLIERVYLDGLNEASLINAIRKIRHGVGIIQIVLTNVKVKVLPQQEQAPEAGEAGIA